MHALTKIKDSANLELWIDVHVLQVNVTMEVSCIEYTDICSSRTTKSMMGSL